MPALSAAALLPASAHMCTRLFRPVLVTLPMPSAAATTSSLPILHAAWDPHKRMQRCCQHIPVIAALRHHLGQLSRVNQFLDLGLGQAFNLAIEKKTVPKPARVA